MKTVVKKMATLLIGLGAFDVNAQFENMDLPKFLLPPPNAFQITRSANVSVGLHTGTAQLSIPLFEYTAGGKKFPLQLNYSSNGVMVDEVASRVGVGWTFNPGGVITRTILDEDDEVFPLRTPPTDPYNMSQLAEYVYPMMPPFNTDQYNTQPDEYRFNLNEMSGKFFYDHTGALRLSSFSDIKIEKNVSNSAWKFKITSPTGVAYYFGGASATERSKYTNSGCSRDRFAMYTEVAWYLNRIEFPNGETVTLNYSTCNFSYTGGVAQTFILLGQADPVPGGTIFGSLPGNSVTTCQSIVNQQGVLLDNIVCSNGTTISFSYNDREDIPGEKVFDHVTESYNGNIVNRFSLTYVYSNSNGAYEDAYYNTPPIDFCRKRPFLIEVRNLGKQGNEALSTTITYNDIDGLPPRLSTAQDHFGYFNGRHNQLYVPALTTAVNAFSVNTDAIGQEVITKFQNSFTGFNGADKEPDFNYSVKGSLQKITYATGGSTSVEWEPNTVNKYVTVYPPPFTETINALGTCPGPNNCATTTIRYLSLSYAQGVYLNGHAGMVIGEDPIHSNMNVNIYNTVNNANVYFKNLKFNESYTETVNLPIGTYRLELTSTTNDIPSSLAYIYRPGNLTAGEFNIPVPGLRVKKVIDFDGNANTNIKKYNYYKLSDSSRSTGVGLSLHYLNSFSHTVNYGGYTQYPAHAPYIVGSITNQYFKLQSSSVYRAYLTGNNAINYATVTESMGTDFENGGIEHTYACGYNTPGQVLYGAEIDHAAFSDNTMFNGLELETRILKNSNNVLVPVNKTVNEYSIDGRNFSWYNCFIVQSRNISSFVYQYTPESNPSNLLQFDIMTYPRYISWVHLDKTTNYAYDDNGNELKIIKTITYENPAHTFPGTETITTSNGKIEQTKYKYTKDYNTIPGLSANSIAAANMMLSKNILNALLEKNIYKDNVLLLKNRTDYKIWNATMPLPEIMSQAYDAGMALKPRVRFYKYDGGGNAGELSKEDDMHLTYLWGYNNLYPVLEATNATKEEIFYTSFEEGSPGVTDPYARTGSKVALNSYTVNFTPPDAKQYVISWHVWNGSSWNYIQQPYTGNSYTITGTKIDEVRIYPKELVSVTTYSYSPLTGISSSCDANGIVTYYEYDNFNRLRIIKDPNRNILKQYAYKYSILAQSEMPQWQSTGNTRCKPCPVNNNYITNILQSEERDINPQSATYNQYRWTDVGPSAGCDVNADWQNTETPLRCRKNSSNQNTGEQEQEQIDMNPCSSTYNQTRWIVVGINYTICPLSQLNCNSSNCNGVDKKCINDICETGVKAYTSSTWNKNLQLWVCIYHYHWSDGSYSGNYTEYSPTNCFVSDHF